ncbi:MAG: DUF4129 domain-containing protein [Candidatus Rokubacteria bacterium]|nr:DUF4129 domain-containing protein [Candidatus Rokubacteria bacterium]
MKTPPGLAGAAVLFWGLMTGFVVVAVAIALVLEGSRLVAWRWDLSRRDVNRISDLCAIGLVGTVLYLSATTEAARVPMAVFQWLPVVVVLLVASQAYAAEHRVDLTTFFFTLRRRAERGGDGGRRSIDLTYPYVVLCALAGGAANVRTPWFYAGLCALAAWALWGARARRVSPVAWAALLLMVSVAGYGGHLALHEVHRALELRVSELLAGLLRDETDPYQSHTAIGHLGTLKLSDRIVLRVELPPGQGPPLLLREASYNTYNTTMWFAVDSTFAAVQPEADGKTWTLARHTGPATGLTVSQYLKRGRGVLAWPHDGFRAEQLGVVGMQRNRLGTIKVDEGLGLVRYRVQRTPAVAVDGPPDANDLKISPGEASIVARVATELGLAVQPTNEILATVARYFGENFRYSMFLAAGGRGVPPLEDFLLRRRAGHCEYFATATVLLLRAAGVPARYATGYSVEEWSRLENAYVVRARHAHSWARVWVDGAWRDFDTTPPVWASVEAEAGSIWEPARDFWAWVVFLFSRWRWGETEDGLGRYVGWLLIPLVAALAWRLYSRKRVRTPGAHEGPEPVVGARAGEDSEFYLIERRLGELVFARAPSESLLSWLARIEAARPPSVPTDPLRDLLSLHYRYRFDPRGLGAAEREALRTRALSWLGGDDGVRRAPTGSAWPRA